MHLGWISLLPGILAAQTPVAAGSDEERYLRWSELAGCLTPRQWTLRPFTSRELEGFACGPRGVRDRAIRGARPAPFGLELQVLPVSLISYFNSSFPWGYNDGPVWQGRGLTLAASGGIAARWGPVNLVLRPTAFWAQNREFELQPNGFSDSLRFAHGIFPTSIDAPQRFGEVPYRRFDWGQSKLALELPLLAAGVSTANQWWGPASVHPLILGNNAPGFRHLFLGTSKPIYLGIGRLHARALWGDLRQSRFTRNLPPADRRLLTGLALVLEPAGMEGLEVGAGRVFHDPWPQGGFSWSHLAKPFGEPLKAQRPPGSNPEHPGDVPEDNGLGSLWMRWVAPGDGFEVYAEYGKEDYNWDLRDFLGEPENSGGYLVGFRKLWGASEKGFWAVEVEHLDLRVSQYVLGRGGTRFYLHGNRAQGHTQLGQILGSEFGVGGLATTVALERYHTRGRWRVSWMRALRQDFESLTPVDPSDPYQRAFRVAALNPEGYDLVHALSAEAVFFRGPLELAGGLSGVYEFNRYFQGDAANLNAWVRVSWQPGSGLGFGSLRHAGREPEGLRPGSNSALASARTDCSFPLGSVLDLSGAEVERCRLDQLLGRARTQGFLLRSSSSLVRRALLVSGGPLFSLLSPRIELVHNSRFPFSLNDGSLWAGAGSNALLTFGVRVDWGPVSIVLAPEIAASANRDFEPPDPALVPLKLPAERDSLSNPWYLRPGSIDLPLRFGTKPFGGVFPGQSTIALGWGALAVGVSTENHWWGPGVLNAIVLSDNAPGFPHWFVRTARPLSTGWGEWEAVLLSGGLTESPFFDRDPSNDLRTISAFALEWRPRWVRGLSLGVTRSVYQPAGNWSDVPMALLDALVSYPGRPNDRPLADSSQVPGADQIYSWFGRWVFPRSGLEVYGEFSKTEFPASLRDFLISPGHTLGYTLGLQWAKSWRGEQNSGVIRLQAEHTFLERSSTFRQKPVGSYYTSRAVVQGYTNRGQVLGAAIGPGASSHWLAVDYFKPRWQVGIFAGRIRWNNDALYTVPLPNPFIRHWCMHDVSLFGGVRAAISGRVGTIAASASRGTRFNTHFRNYSVCGRDFSSEEALDIRYTTFAVSWTVPVFRR